MLATRRNGNHFAYLQRARYQRLYPSRGVRRYGKDEAQAAPAAERSQIAAKSQPAAKAKAPPRRERPLPNFSGQTLEGERLVLKVAGRLQSADISELDKEIRLVHGPYVLDLSELLSVDEAAIARIRELSSNDAELQGASHYVQMLLDD